MKKLTVAAVVVMLVAIFASNAFAQREGFAVGAKGGLLCPLDSDVQDAYGMFYGLGFDVKYYLTDVVSIPLSVVGDIDVLFGRGEEEETHWGVSAKAKYSTTMVPLLTGLMYEFMVDNPFNVFAGLGLGFIYISSKWEVSVGGYEESDSDSETDFGLYFGGGVDYKFNDNWGMKGEFRYLMISGDYDDFNGINLFVGAFYNFM